MVRFLFAAFAAVVLASCSRPPEPVAPPAAKAAVPESLSFADLAPTDQEKAWRDRRVASGKPLTAATIHVAGTFEETSDGKRSGLDWEMVHDFARVLGLPLEVTVPRDLKVFFSRDGVIPSDVETNTGVTYTPDLLKTVDLYIGPFSVLPWRERLMTMVPLYPMQNFLAGRKGEEIRSVAQMAGKRLALLKDSMQDNLLHNLAVKQGLSFRYEYFRPEDDLFAAVAGGRADYTLDGALFFAQNRVKMKGLSLSPFPSDPVRVGWCLKKDDAVLGALVVKYLAKIQENGLFVRWFEEAYGTSFHEYLNLLATSLEPAR